MPTFLDSNGAKQLVAEVKALVDRDYKISAEVTEDINQLKDEVADQKSILTDLTALVDRKAGALVDTASGSIASFVPDSTVPDLLGVTVDIEPVQAGSGDPSPDNVRPISGWNSVEVERTGVNLFGGLEFASSIRSVANMFRLDTDAKTFSFTCSVALDGNYMRPIFTPKKLTRMTAIITYSNSGNNNSIIFHRTDGTRQQVALPNSGDAKTTVVVSSGAGKLVDYVALSYYSAALTTVYYDESGFFEGVLTADDFKPFAGTQYTINLGQTVYGAKLDATAGTLTVDRAMVDLGTLAWLYRNGLFDASISGGKLKRYETGEAKAVCTEYAQRAKAYTQLTDGEMAFGTGYVNSVTCSAILKNSTYTSAADFKTAMSGVQLCYELATPITIQLDPVTISTIANQTNNVWSDAGDVTVEYAADLKTYIDSKIAAAVAALLSV